MRNRLVIGLFASLALGAVGLVASRWAQPPAAPTSAVAQAPAAPAAAEPPAPAAAVQPPAAAPEAAPADLAPQQRREQLEALARTPEGFAQLTRLYADSVDGAEREQVLGAVARVGDAAAVAWLADVAVRDPRLGVQAAQALGGVEDRSVAPLLARLLQRRGPVHLRANAARALGRAGSRAQAPLLLARVSDGRESLRVRQEAALALARVGRGQDASRLSRLLEQLGARKDPGSEQLRIAVVQALGGIRNDAARRALLRHARRPLAASEQAFVRQALAQP